jgi:hypothetical protein
LFIDTRLARIDVYLDCELFHNLTRRPAKLPNQAGGFIVLGKKQWWALSTLMAELATIVRNRCRTPAAGPDGPTFDIVTTANPKQRRALELIGQIRL